MRRTARLKISIVTGVTEVEGHVAVISTPSAGLNSQRQDMRHILYQLSQPGALERLSKT